MHSFRGFSRLRRKYHELVLRWRLRKTDSHLLQHVASLAQVGFFNLEDASEAAVVRLCLNELGRRSRKGLLLSGK